MSFDATYDQQDSSAPSAADGHPTIAAVPPDPAFVAHFQIPRLDAASFAAHADALAEHAVAYNGADRARVGNWLLFACTNSLISERMIGRAMRSKTPCTKLDRLVHVSLQRLARSLRHRTDTACGKRNYESLHISLDDEGSSLRLAFDSYHYIRLDTLHALPTALAGMVYEALILVATSLVECILPHDLISGLTFSHLDECTEEYKQLVAAGVGDDPARAKQYIESNRKGLSFEWLGEYYTDLETMFPILKQAAAGAPPWMRPGRKGTLPSRLQALRRRLTGWLTRFPGYRRHPWVVYCRDILAALHREFPDNKAWHAHERAMQACHIREYFDGETFFGYGLILSTETVMEEHLVSMLNEEMSNSGEYPALHLSVHGVADSPTHLILQRMALGIGLLLRASPTNDAAALVVVP
jgi:hypothetical protein